MVISVEVGPDGVPYLPLGDYVMRLDLEELNEDYKAKAEKELRETPENVQEALKKLREKIREEPGLYVPVDDDDFLKKFLRPCKFYPDSTFKILRKFYKFRMKHPKFAMNLSPRTVRMVFDEEVCFFLPSRTTNGARLMILNVGTKWNPKNVSLQDIFRCVIVAIEIAMMEPKTQVGGVHVILNLEGFSFVHLYQLSPHLAKLILEWVQECTPVRLKGIHIINQPYIFKMAYAIFKPFLGEKLKRRLFFHGTNKESLCEKISPNALPEYYGGTANIPYYPGCLMSEMLFFYEDIFELHNTYCYRRDDAEKANEDD